MTDTDYMNDLALFTNASAQAKSLLHSLEQAEKGTDFYIKADKAEFMCFQQDGTIFTFNAKPLRFVDPFTCIRKNISSTEIDIKLNIWKMMTAIYR